MPQWFKGTISYQQPINDATVSTRNEEFIRQKVVTESYLFDAVSFTDAETRLYQEVAANTPDFEVKAIDRKKYADVFRQEDGEDWYEVKADFLTEDDKTGKQKRVPSLMLINATSNAQANERITQLLKTALDPFEIMDVKKTKIIEVFEFQAQPA